MKLTPAQRALLNDIGRGDEIVHATYSPAVKIVALGLAIWRHNKFGRGHLSITPAGRAAITREPTEKMK